MMARFTDSSDRENAGGPTGLTAAKLNERPSLHTGSHHTFDAVSGSPATSTSGLDRFLDFAIPVIGRTFAGIWHRCRCGSPFPVPPGQAALVIANHPSHADAAFLIAASGRRIHYLQAHEQYDIFLLRHFFHLIGCIPVTRGRPDLAAIRTGLDRLRQGAVVGIFPEGDVSVPGATQLRPGRTGAALLALRSGALVVPAFIDGGVARGIVVDWLRPVGGVRVKFGPPIDLSEYRQGAITREKLHKVTDLLMARIEELRPQKKK